MYTTLKEQIAIMQHYADGGKIEYRVKPDVNKPGPRAWTVVLCRPDNGFAFDWENEDIRIKREPREFGIVYTKDGVAACRYDTGAQAADKAEEWNKEPARFTRGPYTSAKFVEVL